MALFKRKPASAEATARQGKKEIKKEQHAGSAWNVLVEPHVTEKATYLTEQNKYIFKVTKNANKEEVRKAVEGVYGVEVENVNIVNIHPKKRRVGKKGEGWRVGYKKAIVGVKIGQKIEIISR